MTVTAHSQDYNCLNAVLKAVFRIRDILVRIRIRGSVHLTNGSDLDPALFVSDLQDATKIFLRFLHVTV
jgi:hypothetical protein